MGMDSTRCRYCGGGGDSLPAGELKARCPTKDANPEWAIAQWVEGFDRGFADEFIRWYEGELPGASKLQEAFIRKFNNLCEA